MLIESKQNVDLWEAWIDLQTTANGGAATLYLIGDVFTDDRLAQPYFIKREHNNPKILALEILPGITSEDGYVCGRTRQAKSIHGHICVCWWGIGCQDTGYRRNILRWNSFCSSKDYNAACLIGVHLICPLVHNQTL